MSKRIFLMSASSNSGKTVLANGLLHLSRQSGKKVQFYKALAVDTTSYSTKDGGTVAAYMKEYSGNAGVALDAVNNTNYYNPENQNLYCHGKHLTKTRLVTRDNIDCDSLAPSIIAKIKEQITRDIIYLKEHSEVLIAEGGGNCMLGQGNEFSNRWPAIEFDFSVVLVVEGRDGGGFLSLLGLKQTMPMTLQQKIAGFVVNGVLERTEVIESHVANLAKETQWTCLGILPWFDFDENSSYQDWQSTLSEQLHRHAQPLLALI